MRLNAIEFEEGEEGAVPAEITVTMTLEEAASIAKVFGEFNDAQLKKFVIPHTEIYNVLTSDVFNRYWEDGLDGVRLMPAGNTPACFYTARKTKNEDYPRSKPNATVALCLQQRPHAETCREQVMEAARLHRR